MNKQQTKNASFKVNRIILNPLDIPAIFRNFCLKKLESTNFKVMKMIELQ